MKIAVNLGKDLPIGPLDPAAITIPQVCGFPRKSCKSKAPKTLGPGSVKALNLTLNQSKSCAGEISAIHM